MRKNTTKSIVTGGDAGSLAGAEPLAQLAAAAVSDGTALSAHGAPRAPAVPAPGAATLALSASLPRLHHG